MLVTDRAKALEIVKAFSDEYSRKILLSVISRSLPIEEISAEEHIPISTCYRRVRDLENTGILRADRTIISKEGKKYVLYKTSFKNVRINLDSGELTVDIVPNRDPSEKLHDIWVNMRNTEDSPVSSATAQEEKVETEQAFPRNLNQ